MEDKLADNYLNVCILKYCMKSWDLAQKATT